MKLFTSMKKQQFSEARDPEEGSYATIKTFFYCFSLFFQMIIIIIFQLSTMLGWDG